MQSSVMVLSKTPRLSPSYRFSSSSSFSRSWLNTFFPALLSLSDTNTKRETGKAAQFGNIQAAKAVLDIIRTTLGPRSMLKMLLDPMGGIVMTNDGNCILREVDVSHPAAKSMIELSRAQDEEVGDGTTSVIVLSKNLQLFFHSYFLLHYLI